MKNKGQSIFEFIRGKWTCPECGTRWNLPGFFVGPIYCPKCGFGK